MFILAAVGAKAFYLLMIWLASAIAASELSKRKGYGEKWGLGTGLLRLRAGLLEGEDEKEACGPDQWSHAVGGLNVRW